MYSDADFDRADTDIEDDDHTSYYEEVVTDYEAMQKKKEELGIEDDSDDDSDFGGGYMPSIIANTDKGTDSKPKIEKITKTIRKKKEKKPVISKNKPPRGVSQHASPNMRSGSPDMKPASPTKVMSDN
jgi:hypothetical protein